jgi:DNA-binding XRE family transcriptional regulator
LGSTIIYSRQNGTPTLYLCIGNTYYIELFPAGQLCKGNFDIAICYYIFNFTKVGNAGDAVQYYELFSMRIRQLCKKQGITVNRLATLSGLKQSTIDNILRGTSKNPKVHTLHQIAVTFNMTLSEFLDFPELNDYPIDDEE